MGVFIIGMIVLVILTLITAAVVIAVTHSINWLMNLAFPRKPVQPLPALEQQAMQRCRRSNCRTANPKHARFCRRCGVAMAATQVDLRRVAAML